MAKTEGLGTGYGDEVSFPTVRDAGGAVYPLETAKIVERISTASPGDVQSIAGSQIALLLQYYGTVLEQARQSFRWALIAAGAGFAFLLAAVGFLLGQAAIEVAVISTIAGVVVEVISGLNFYLYGQTTKQLASYHLSLERTQRFLLANSICEALEGDERQKARADLVKLIAKQADDVAESAASEGAEPGAFPDRGRHVGSA